MCRYVIVPQIYSDCEELQPHVIGVKHVIQCQAASHSSKQSDLPVNNRICENPVHIGRDIEGDEDIEKEAGACLTCLGAEAVTEAFDSEAPVYTAVHAYRAIRFREKPHIIDIGHAVPTVETLIGGEIRTSELKIDLLDAFEIGNRLQEFNADAEQKAMAVAKQPEHPSQDIPGPFLEQQTAASSRDSAGQRTKNRLAWSSLRKKAPSTTSSSNIASTVFSRQSHQSAGTDGTSVSDYFPKPLIRTIGSLDLESVPEKREPSISFTTGYENLGASAVREHMENSWIEAEVDGEVFYVNYFYKRKSQWEKPRNAFIKVLPRTEQSQGDAKRQMGRGKYTEYLSEKQLSKGMTGRRKRDGGDGSGREEDRDSEPEIIGCTKLYQAVHRGFKEIIGRVSEPTNDDYTTVEPLSSFKPWIKSLWTRLNIWSREIGVGEAALDSLEDHKTQASNAHLNRTLTKYLTSVYESLKLIEQNIREGLQNLNLVEKHSAMHQFILKTMRESIASYLEEIDSLLDKLFLLVDPIKIFSALANKTGPYAAVVEAVGKFGLNSEDTADKHQDTTLHSTSDESPPLRHTHLDEPSELRWVGEEFRTLTEALNEL